MQIQDSFNLESIDLCKKELNGAHKILWLNCIRVIACEYDAYKNVIISIQYLYDSDKIQPNQIIYSTNETKNEENKIWINLLRRLVRRQEIDCN